MALPAGGTSELRTKTRMAAGAVAACLLPLVGVLFGTAAAQELRLGPPPGDLLPEARQVLDSVCELYTSTNPGATIVVADGNREFDPFKAELEDLGDVLFLSGSGYGQASLLAVYTKQGYLAPLSARVDEPSFNRRDFYPNLWESVSIDGTVWAVPVLVRSWGVGVDASQWDPEEIRGKLKDWDTFGQVLAAFHVDSDGDGEADSSLVSALQSPIRLWENFFLANGGDPNDAASYNPKSRAWRRATQQFERLLRSNRHAFKRSELPLSYRPEAPGIVSFVHNDPMDTGALPLLRRNHPDWVLLPAPGSKPLAPLDCTVAAVRRSTPEREQAAWEFIEWLVSPKVMEAVYPPNSLVPLRRSVASTVADPDLREFGRQVERMKFQAPLAEDSVHRATLVAQIKALFGNEKAEW